MSQTTRLNLRSEAEKRSEQMRKASVKGASRIKELFRKYGYLAITVYIGVYITTLSSLYMMVSYGVIPKGNIDSIFISFGLEENFKQAKERLQSYLGKGTSPEDSQSTQDRITDNVNSFITAWLLAKVTEPMRILFTAGTVPMISRFLKR